MNRRHGPFHAYTVVFKFAIITIIVITYILRY